MNENELRTAILEFYNINHKITIRDFKNKNGLPSIQYIKKHFGIGSIIEIKEFCGIEVSGQDKNLSNRHKYTYEEIYNIFKERNCVLLSTELTDGVFTKVKYKCECGNISYVKISDFIAKDIRCMQCGINKSANGRKLSYNDLKTFYKNNGCILLSKNDEYVNQESKLKFKCKCGLVDKKTFSAFKLTPKCYKCHEHASMGNHYSWKGGISPINEYLRKHILEWKKDSSKKYNYKSDISGKPFEVIHHVNKNFSEISTEVLNQLDLEPKQINEYSENELNNITNLCIELHYKYGLGVCLTEKEHKLFHSIYGKENNTIQQYEEFKQQYKQLISTTIESGI